MTDEPSGTGRLARLRSKGPAGIRAGLQHRLRVQLMRRTPWLVGRAWARLAGVLAPRRRLVAVWNGRVWPYAIGNLLELQVATQVAAFERGLERIDMVYVIEPKQVEGAASSPALSISAEQALQYLPAIIQTTSMNPLAHSISVVRTMADCEAMLVRLGRGARLWPERRFAVDPSSDPLAAVRRMITDHARRHGHLPGLRPPEPVRLWAERLLHDEVAPSLPIAIGIRRNPAHDPERSSDIESWLALLERARGRLPVVFVVVCSASEVDPRLRELPNVLVAKDRATSLDQDMALVASSAAFMGVSSGLKDVAVFGNRPYAILRFPDHDLERRIPDAVTLGDGALRHGFAADTQRLIARPDSPERLEAELERLLAALPAPAKWWHHREPPENPLAPSRSLILR